MKKIDKLILSSFLGPFFLTFLVVVFILLTQHMIKYFDDIVGKDIGWDVLSELLFYFAVFMTPIAIPLAVLLSSLITFGNLGEHFELTAIKASGISLLRALLPIFLFVCLLTVFAFYSNNNFVPRAALEAYSLLYDIKQKKPSMDLKEGAFYNGIPDYSIKVENKLEDGQTIEDVIIYDHTSKSGNKEVTIAKSGKMYTILNDRYLKLELFDGNSYVEGANEMNPGSPQKQEFTQSQFKKSQIVLDLSSFQLGNTDKSLFTSNKVMRNVSQLNNDVDSMNTEITSSRLRNFRMMGGAFLYLNRINEIQMPEYLETFEKKRIEELASAVQDKDAKKKRDSILEAQISTIKDTSKSQTRRRKKVRPESLQKQENKTRLADNNKKIQQEKIDNKLPNNKDINKANPDSIIVTPESLKSKAKTAYNYAKSGATSQPTITDALNKARQIKTWVSGNKSRLDDARLHRNVYQIQWHKIIANSFACLIMFLIGAPLGAIIKRGGLGVPVLVSILFFIIFYVFNMTGEKYAKQNLLEPWIGIWSANILLLPIGLFFLRQARIDARLFDSDFYNVIIDKVNQWILKKKKKSKVIYVDP